MKTVSDFRYKVAQGNDSWERKLQNEPLDCLRLLHQWFDLSRAYCGTCKSSRDCGILSWCGEGRQLLKLPILYLYLNLVEISSLMPHPWPNNNYFLKISLFWNCAILPPTFVEWCPSLFLCLLLTFFFFKFL